MAAQKFVIAKCQLQPVNGFDRPCPYEWESEHISAEPVTLARMAHIAESMIWPIGSQEIISITAIA
jgi:hypothetical protein